MCLAVPGQIVSHSGEGFCRVGQVRFGDAVLEVNLAFVPEAREGNYVLVHAGIAIGALCEDGAARSLAVLETLVLEDTVLEGIQ